MTRVKSRESKLLFIMILSVIVGCIVEPLAFILDGIPGKFNHIMVFVSNTILFSLNVIIGPCYVTLITSHINKTLSRLQIIVVFTLCTLETLMLFINIFIPMIFIVGSDNIYVRKPFFWVYTAVEAGMMLYGLLVFFIARGKGKLLKFFPAWQFFIPVFVGLLLQGLMYGVSVIWPSIGIAVCSTVLCLQNENIFLDKLTGVFNRYYLDELKKVFKSERKVTIGAMMLDMNGFKHINDT